jgi:hypothetical protein
LIDKQIEVIGPANMKSKESQATIKNLESLLSAYFAATKELSMEPPQFSFPAKSHEKVVAFEANLPAQSVVHRLEAFSVNVDALGTELRAALERKRNTKVLAWLNFDESPTDQQLIGDPENRDVVEKSNPDNVVENVTSAIPASKKEPQLWNEYSKGINRVANSLALPFFIR